METQMNGSTQDKMNGTAGKVMGDSRLKGEAQKASGALKAMAKKGLLRTGELMEKAGKELKKKGAD